MENKKNKIYKPLSTSSSLTDRVCDLIKDVILNGKYDQNQRLNEVELSASLGVSRGPIREAIQRLANDGLVNLVPNKGAFIPSFNLEEYEELLEVRECLELMAVRLAVERGDQSQYRKLAELLRTTERVIEKNKYTFYPWDSDFHLQIAKCAKNKKLENIIHKINSQILLMRYRSGSKSGRATEAFKQHTEIYKALYERNREEAERLMIQHLRSSKDNMMQFIVPHGN